MRLSVCDESFGATRRTRVPSSLRHAVGCACLRRDTPNALQACSRLVAPYLHAAECTHAAYKPLFFSLVRRMIATLINCVAEKASAHSKEVLSVTFSPDGTKIVSGSYDATIKVWDSGAPRALKIAPPRPKLTPVGLSGRQPGDAAQEDERPQPTNRVGGVFPGRDQDCVGIGRRDDKSLGFECAEALKIAPPWPKLTPAGLSDRQTEDAEQEEVRPQQGHQFGRVFPGRDQDCVRIGRQDDQSLGFGCAASSKSPLLGQN